MCPCLTYSHQAQQHRALATSALAAATHSARFPVRDPSLLLHQTASPLLGLVRKQMDTYK